mgnify:CR=1 FL=1
MSFTRSTLRPSWWEKASCLVRPYLKASRRTLRDLIHNLDMYQAMGIGGIEVFAPLQGGLCYHGLDTLDFYKIDPEIGSLDDFITLINEAHARNMAIVMFINLGYSHEQFPEFLKACDDIRRNEETAEAQMFCWSRTGKDTMDRSLAPYFMNDLHGQWHWSDRAESYYWVKWEGEQGGYHLPQFNFASATWQNKVKEILQYWLNWGIDGIVIDAVNWYIGCTWEICRESMTDILKNAGNLLSQPEGAGGFNDDPVVWITRGGWNCLMDYSIKLWWEGKDVIRSAILSGDPTPVEVALRSYRDRVVNAGGICYIDPPDLNDVSLDASLLGAALTASIGELMIFIGDPFIRFSEEYLHGVTRLLKLRQQFPALCAGGHRWQLHTSDNRRFYAVLREQPGEKSVIGVYNFQPQEEDIQIDLGEISPDRLTDCMTGEILKAESTLHLHLPSFGYRFFWIE